MIYGIYIYISQNGTVPPFYRWIYNQDIMGIQPTQYGDVMIYNPSPGSVLKQPQDIVVDVGDEIAYLGLKCLGV